MITNERPGLCAACGDCCRTRPGVEEPARFLAAHPDFRLLPASDVLAAQNVALAMGDYLRLDTANQGTDGFFAAVMERVA